MLRHLLSRLGPPAAAPVVPASKADPDGWFRVPKFHQSPEWVRNLSALIARSWHYTEIALEPFVAEALRLDLYRRAVADCENDHVWRDLKEYDRLMDLRDKMFPANPLNAEMVADIRIRGRSVRLAGDGEVSREDWSSLTGCRKILVVRAADIGLS